MGFTRVDVIEDEPRPDLDMVRALLGRKALRSRLSRFARILAV